MAFRIW